MEERRGKIGEHIQEEKNQYNTPDTHIILQQTGKSVLKADSTSSSNAHFAFLFVPHTYD